MIDAIVIRVVKGNLGGCSGEPGFRPDELDWLMGSVSLRREGGMMSSRVRICDSVYQFMEQG